MKHLNMKNWEEPMKRLTDVLANNSSTILTAFGAVGLVVTTILAVMATIKAAKIVDEHRDEINEAEKPCHKKADVVRLTWKCYIPVVTVGAASLGCIIGANSINLKRNAAILAAVATTEDKLKTSELGKDILKPKSDTGQKKDGASTDGQEQARTIIVNDGEYMCKDEWSGRFFKASLMKIREAETNLSKLLLEERNVTVNELYEELGLEMLPVGETYGWQLDDINQFHLDVDAVMDDVNGPVMLLLYNPNQLDIPPWR